jgi:hypothetical protein
MRIAQDKCRKIIYREGIISFSAIVTEIVNLNQNYLKFYIITDVRYYLEKELTSKSINSPISPAETKRKK